MFLFVVYGKKRPKGCQVIFFAYANEWQMVESFGEWSLLWTHTKNLNYIIKIYYYQNIQKNHYICCGILILTRNYYTPTKWKTFLSFTISLNYFILYLFYFSSSKFWLFSFRTYVSLCCFPVFLGLEDLLIDFKPSIN